MKKYYINNKEFSDLSEITKEIHSMSITIIILELKRNKNTDIKKILVKEYDRRMLFYQAYSR